MNPTELQGTFWYGTHYYRPPSPPPHEWDDDFKRLQDMGLTLIQVRAFWRCYEMSRDNFCWDDLDRFMDQAGDNGMKVVHQIMLENAPQYIFDEDQGYRVDMKGVRIWPISNAAMYPGGWLPCFDNPAVLERGLHFVRLLVQRYKDHQAFAFWHAWNEPRCRPMGECTCRHSIESYQRWLKDRFGTIERLNERFGKYWPSFDSVDAARDTCDYADMFLWKYWATYSVHDRVDAVVRTVRECDPTHAVISHVGINSIQQDTLFDISDDELMADVADMYGSSFEVRYEPEPVKHSLPFMVCDWLRHVCRGTYTIYELYPSRGRFEEEIPAHQFQQWMWIPPACGARSTFLWQFKKERLGFETNDAGLIEIDGSDNPTSMQAREGFRHYAALADQMSSWKVPDSQTAIVYDLDSDLTNRMESTMQRDVDYTQAYRLRWSLPCGHPYKNALHGIYHLFWLENIQVDVVSSRRLEQVTDTYRTLYLPGMVVVDQARAEQLCTFVSNGGTLIVDACFAWRDSNTWMHPGRPMPTIADAFSYRESMTRVGPEVRNRACLHEGMCVDTSFVQAALECTNQHATIHARWPDNTAAAISCPLGKGNLVVLGFSPGISYIQRQDDNWRTFLRYILDQARSIVPTPGIGDIPEAVSVRTLEDGQGRSIVCAFRRWGCDGQADHTQWQQWMPIGYELLFEQSHVKCFRKL